MQNSTIRALIARQTGMRQVAVGAALACAGSAALAISAWIRVPMFPVPMTMQTAVVLMLGATLGARVGTAAAAAYLLEGALGLPVFAGASLIGTTGGYLAGFLLATFAVGLASERGWMRHPVGLFATLLAGEALIYLPGMTWLHVGFGLDLHSVLAGGLLPFLPGELVKFALVGGLLTAVRQR